MKNKNNLIAAFCAAFLMTPVYATELVIYVYADRTPSIIASNTYSYDIVETDELEDISSLDILSSGPKGQMSSLFIRGADSDQSLITLNGIAIKDHSSPTGTDDLGQHNFTGIDVVEVYKGPMSSLYGANAAGGVVNLVSDVTSRSYIGSTIGNNNSVAVETQLSGKVKNLDYTLTIDGERTDGISVYPDGEETDPYENKNVNLNLLYHTDYSNYRLMHIDETNYSNLDSQGDTLEYTGDWNWTNTQLDYNNETVRVTLNNSNHRRIYTKGRWLEGDYDSTVNTLYASKLIKVDNNDIIVGTEVEKIDADFLLDTGGVFPYYSSVDKKRTTKGIFVNNNSVVNGTVLSYGVRHDAIDGFGEKDTGRIGIANNGIRASVSSGYRVPTLYEMYGKDNYGFNGNPNLLEEDTISYEIGFRNSFIDTAIFLTKEDNAIIYNGTYVNDSERSFTKGFEGKTTHELSGVYIENNISIIDARQSNGERKLRRPNVTNKLKLSKIIDEIVYSFDVDYYGKHKDIDSITYQTIDVDALVTYNAGIDYRKNDWNVFLGIYNISNEKYQRPNGYSQLGRNAEVGFRKYF